MLEGDPRAFIRQANKLAGTHLAAGRTLRLAITSASMLPTLAPGDHVIVQGATVDDVERGDIILRDDGIRLVAHRLLAKRMVDGKWVLITKGDNSLTADAEWQATQLWGIVVTIEHRYTTRRLLAQRARWANRFLANFSQLLWYLSARRQGLVQRALHKIGRGAFQQSVVITNWIAR